MMDIYSKLLQRIPLFRHCTEDEISHLRSIGRTTRVARGRNIDLKGVNSLNIVVNGMFEIEALGRNDILYLAPGSFFGVIPFTNNIHRGMVKALADSTLLCFEKEDILKFFLIYYKALRGYLRTVQKMGFDISDIGDRYFGQERKVVTVYSRSRQAGKSLFAAIAGTALSKKGRTVILDLSYGGESLFTLFDVKITSPLSHKQVDGSSAEEQVINRIERAGENLDLVNVAFGSKVRVEPDILSPLLFVLSKEYRYIIMDVSDVDDVLRDRAFALSDVIFSILKNKKTPSRLYDLFDGRLDEAQRVYYVLNEYHCGPVSDYTGGYVLEKMDLGGEAGVSGSIRKIIDAGNERIERMMAPVTTARKGLVVESLYFDAVFLSGFFSNLFRNGARFDVIYTSSLSFIMLALYQNSANEAEFKKAVSSFFSEDKINRLLDITFPDDYVFKNSLIEKTARDLCGETRLEMFSLSPVALLNREGEDKRQIMSTGYLRDIFSASFLVYPVFESMSIYGRSYSSGFPGQRAAVQDLFRTDISEISHVAVQNNRSFSLKKGRVLPFYTKYVSFLENAGSEDDKINMLADSSYMIEVPDKALDMNDIFSETEKASAGFFEKISG